MALLQRQVERIVVFENSNVPISRDNDGKIVVDSIITNLFGRDNKDYPNNQVFSNNQLDTLLEGLWQAKESGGLCVCETKHTTIENPWFGISAYSVKVLWVYNAPVNGWIEQLSDQVKQDVKQGIQGKGDLAHFPNYQTMDENGLVSIHLTAYQVATMSSMFSSAIQKQADLWLKLVLTQPKRMF